MPLLYWTAASWGSAIALGARPPELVIDMPTVRALAERAIALDETWSKGTLHEMFISLDSLPPALGGIAGTGARALSSAPSSCRRALSPGPYVALALGVAVPAQDRAEFEKLLKQALAIDPEKDPSNQPRHARAAAARARAARSDRHAVPEVTRLRPEPSDAS